MPVATQAPVIELESIRWERVQLIIEARTDPEAAADPAAFSLVSAGGGTTETMPPTRATVDGDHLTIRFNVMVGPGLQPLSAGRWTLRAPMIVGDAAALDPLKTVAVFPLVRGLYTATPVFEPPIGDRPGRLHVDVTFDDTLRRVVELAPGERARRKGRRWVRLLRRAAFNGIVAIAKRLQRPGPPRVLFTSRLISEMSGNLKAVHDRMVERGLDRDHHLVTMLKPASASDGRSPTGSASRGRWRQPT